MTARSQPPELEGYTYVEPLGSGGFADVFLYRQHLPIRQVAVKVLHESQIAGDGRARFDAEANLMAQVSTHPSIVDIYAVGTASDGRPYLVMEYCPNPNLATRYRSEHLSVPEVLEIGIQVAGALETAHRAGILHRDVKPANILTDAYGHAKLTDFGIAVVTGGTDEQGIGMSVPWSPPEMFEEEPPEDVRSDVFSLAATIYTLLAGHSPFEVAGGPNDSAVLMSRIERQPLPRLTRPDVNDRLNDVLALAMAKDLTKRPSTVNGFARSLQDVQVSMHLNQTRIDVLDASPSRPRSVEDDGRTRLQPIAIIRPSAPIGTPSVPQPLAAVDDSTQLKGLGLEPAPVAPVADTFVKEPPAEPEADEPQSPRSRARWWAISVAALVLLATGTGVGLARGGSPDDQGDSDPRRSLGAEDSGNPIGQTEVPPPIEDVNGVRKGGQVRFSWTNPAPHKGDFYYWTRTGDGAPEQWKQTQAPRVSFTAASTEAGCIKVLLARADGTARGKDEATTSCPEVAS